MIRRRITARLALGTLVATAIAGMIWLSKAREDANTAPVVSMAAPGRAASEADSPKPQTDDFGSTTGDAARASRSSTFPSREAPPAGAMPALHLRFEAPHSVAVGQAFDYLVIVDSLQSVGRISLQVTYDPALVRVRSVEEVDYATRAGVERSFASEESTDGRVSLFLAVRPGSRPMAATERVAVVQFEAIAPGWAQIAVDNIEASDIAHQALTIGVPDRQSLVVVN
jgi:hypothetical protein